MQAAAWPPPSDVAALDAALTLALDQSHDQLEALQKDRDKCARRATDQEAELARLSSLLERTEAHRVGLLEERRRESEQRQRDSEELQRLRHEHQKATSEAAAVHFEAEKVRSSASERCGHLERLVAEQQRRIEQMEEVSSRASSLGDALYTCITERAGLLRFLAETLHANHALLSERPPDMLQAMGAPVKRGSSSARRSDSCERTLTGRGSSVGRAGTGPSVDADLRGLTSSLKAEWESTVRGLKLQAERVAREAEQATAVLSLAPSAPSDQQQQHAHASLACGERSQSQQSLSPADVWAAPLTNVQSKEVLVQHICAYWLEQERLRRERLGLHANLSPCVDWIEERIQYQATAQAAESKFAQLAKVRRLQQAQPSAAQRKK